MMNNDAKRSDFMKKTNLQHWSLLLPDVDGLGLPFFAINASQSPPLPPPPIVGSCCLHED